MDWRSEVDWWLVRVREHCLSIARSIVTLSLMVVLFVGSTAAAACDVLCLPLGGHGGHSSTHSSMQQSASRTEDASSHPQSHSAHPAHVAHKNSAVNQALLESVPIQAGASGSACERAMASDGAAEITPQYSAVSWSTVALPATILAISSATYLFVSPPLRTESAQASAFTSLRI